VRVVSADTDPLDRFDIFVDPDAGPADLDEALAEFLLKVVHMRHAAHTPAAAQMDTNK
jgi:hypothetical protein